MHKPFVITKELDKSTPLMKAGTGSLNTSTLGGEIVAAVEQSIVNTTKSNIKDY